MLDVLLVHKGGFCRRRSVKESTILHRLIRKERTSPCTCRRTEGTKMRPRWY